VESIAERLSLYTRLDNCETDTQLESFKNELVDRFGPAPKPVHDLFTALQCRWLAQHAGFEKVVIKNKQLRLYFVSNHESAYFDSPNFKHVLDVMQFRLKNARLKHVGTSQMLVVDGVQHIDQLKQLLEWFILPKTELTDLNNNLNSNAI
jgi:transcription-repair coupling factor (superfamily II helicase)